MNPVFVILVCFIAFMIWLTFSFLYRPIRKFFGRLWSDAKEAMDEEDDKKESKEEKTNEQEG